MKAALIVNKKAGSSSNGNDEFSTKNIINILKNNNIDAEVYEIEQKNPNEITDIFSSKGFDFIAASGGDGTISSVASALVDKEIPLGVLPAGTLNHFAKDNGIPLPVEEAVKILAKKHTKKIDVGDVNGKTFINNSSIGFYPKIVKRREKDKEKLWGNKWLSMLFAFVKVLSRFPVINLTIKEGGEKKKIKVPFIFIGNNEYQFDLFNLGSREKLDGGKLSLYYPNTTGRISMLRFAFFALINKLDQVRDFSSKLIDEFSLEIRKKNIDVSIDGEVTKLNPPLHYKIRPLSLIVITPEK